MEGQRGAWKQDYLKRKKRQEQTGLHARKDIGKDVGQAHMLQGHGGQIRSICFSADPSLLASASEDGTIKLWEVKDSPEVEVTCSNTLISGRPYEGMNITKARGLTDAQRLSLLALGAVDNGAHI